MFPDFDPFMWVLECPPLGRGSAKVTISRNEDYFTLPFKNNSIESYRNAECHL